MVPFECAPLFPSSPRPFSASFPPFSSPFPSAGALLPVHGGLDCRNCRSRKSTSVNLHDFSLCPPLDTGRSLLES
eukprot:3918403-Rhodomonas_salina.1